MKSDIRMQRLLFVKQLLSHPAYGAGVWSLQGFGMFRLYLSPEVRLHVWDPRFAVEGVTTIHTHPWDFVSEILSGRMIDRTYHRCDSGIDTHHEEVIVCGPGGCATGEVHHVRLEQSTERLRVAGECYELSADESHESSPAPGTVTLITRRMKADTEHARVYYPLGTKWVSAEPRPALKVEVDSMCTLALDVLSKEIR